MHLYIINLDGATERWEFVTSNFVATGLQYTRVPGVNGRELVFPHPEYDELTYTRRHGHKRNLGAIGCYLSHLKALRTFLESSHELALIAEDDAYPVENLQAIVESATRWQETWDVLRLCGFHDSHPRPFVQLDERYSLNVCMTRLCGTACYAVTRRAAEALVQGMSPMQLPIDHAIDREWIYGLRAAAVYPLPVSQRQHRFKSQCGAPSTHKLPWYVRYWTVFPYRATNEVQRYFARRQQWMEASRLVKEVLEAKPLVRVQAATSAGCVPKPATSKSVGERFSSEQ